MFYIIIAVLAGIFIVVSRIINSNLANKIGLFQGVFFNYTTGLLVSLILVIFTKELSTLNNITTNSIPLWAYLGGFTGVMVVVLSNYLTPKISAFYQTLFVFIGQLFIGIIIDYFISQELSMAKIIGGTLVLLGLTYNLLLDKKMLKS